MEKSRRRQVKLRPYTLKLDEDEFNSLTDLLFELMKENHSACAKLLGINRVTWRKWEKEAPEWPWWNLVLRHAIKLVLASITARRGLTRSHKRKIQERLNAIPNHSEFEEELGSLAYSWTGCEAHLRAVLAPGGMFWDQIRLPANSGGYSPKTLRVAARSIGVVKTQEGYGENKRSYWRLPDQDDD